MSVILKSTCHILRITSMKKGRQRLREDHQHTYMMSYYNYVYVSYLQFNISRSKWHTFGFYNYRQDICMYMLLWSLNLNQFGKFYSFMFKNLEKTVVHVRDVANGPPVWKFLFCCFHLVFHMRLCACKITTQSITDVQFKDQWTIKKSC